MSRDLGKRASRTVDAMVYPVESERMRRRSPPEASKHPYIFSVFRLRGNGHFPNDLKKLLEEKLRKTRLPR
jgi:hypothetical protein